MLSWYHTDESNQELMSSLRIAWVEPGYLASYKLPLPHAHRHGDHFEKHPAHHATHERMGKVCAQLQPVPLGNLKIFGDLSTRETGEKGERDKKEASDIRCWLRHTESHTPHQQKHIAHAAMHEHMNTIGLDGGAPSVFPEQESKQGLLREQAAGPPQGGRRKQDDIPTKEVRCKPTRRRKHERHAESHQPMSYFVFCIKVAHPSTTSNELEEGE